MNKFECRALRLNSKIVALEGIIKETEDYLIDINDALLIEDSTLNITRLKDLKEEHEVLLKKAIVKRNNSVKLKAWTYYFLDNHIDFLGNKLNIAGFTSLEEVRNKFKDYEIIYEGLLENLTEEQAILYVSKMPNFWGDFIYMDYSRNRPVIGFKTAKESIISACNMPYIVIYKTN